MPEKDLGGIQIDKRNKPQKRGKVKSYSKTNSQRTLWSWYCSTMLVQINTTYSAVVKGLTSLKCSLNCYFPFIFCLNLFSIYSHDRASSSICNILFAFSRFGDVINPSIFNHCSALWRPQCTGQTICFIFALLNANINYFLYGFRHFHICVQQVHCFVC